MSKNNNKFKKLTYVLAITFAICLTFLCGSMFSPASVYAYTSKQPDSISSSTNLNFSYDSNTSYLASSPTGWSKGFSNEESTSGVINLDNIKDSYYLETDQKPQKIQGADDYVLMINSKTSKSSIKPAVQYYSSSSSISLSSYSTYKIKIYTQVSTDARASIYLTGLTDENSNAVNMSFENITYAEANEWTTFTFYVTTGLETQNVKLELWLGAKTNFASTGVVFFDNIEFVQIAEKDIDLKQNSKHVSLDKSNMLYSFDDSNPLSDWTAISAMETNAHAEVLDLSTNASSLAKEITYVGTDNSTLSTSSTNSNYLINNKKAFVFYTKEETSTFFGFKSNNIDVSIYDIVKISINVKTANLSGNAYIKLIENDVLDANGNVIEAITPVSETITISSSSTNQFLNDYTTCTFYVKARSLYNSSFNLELWLGSQDASASGLVAFDTIKIEDISYDDFTNASTSSTVAKLTLDSDPSNYIISNSAFNDVKKLNKTLTYPLTPANWTHSTKDNNLIYFGVINTNKTVYDAHMSEFGNVANPGNPKGFGSTDSDTNNILVMHNIDKTYQQVTSSDFSVDSNSYYKLSFDLKLLETSTDSNIFNVYVKDDENNIIYANENLTGSHIWENYSIYISTKAYSNTLKLVLSLGTETNNVQGIAYIDNVILVKDTSLTEEQYKTIAKTNNVLDFEQGNFNLFKKDNQRLFTPLRYTEKLENCETATSGLNNGFGGIIDTEDEYNNVQKSPNSQSSLSYIMMIQTLNKATYSLTAKDSFSLSSDTYHKFSIDILTKGLNAETSDEKFGAVFALSGLDEKIDGIIAEEWTTYTIYVACTTSTTINLKFALESLNIDTSGIAFFDNFSYETIEKDDYNLAKLNESSNTSLFIGNTDTTEDTNTSTSETNLEYIWYVIPTLILAVALILALVAYLMKKVKIKKWEKRKINEYDRDKTLHRDVIRKEAEERRNSSVKEIKESLSELEKEKQHIEEVHQEQLKAKRVDRSKGVTASTEREFKQYAKLHTALENRIASLNKQIDKMNTAEYLLSVQHKIILEKAKQERLAKEKAYKANKKKKSK